ncbi:7887_t:CDS:2, partial [Gigaspora margarita]
LHKLGFRYKYYLKDVYIDGHERPDVVAYRQVFLQKYDKDCKIRTYPLLADREKEHIWEQPLKKIGMGLGIHISDFLTEMIRPLRDDRLFAFDNAITHMAFDEDALLSSKMNLFQ